MIGLAVALAMAQATPVHSSAEVQPFPPCVRRARICRPWERNWGAVAEDDYRPIIRTPAQMWSVQTRALATPPQYARPRAWVRIDYAPSHQGNERQVMSLHAFDCTARRYATLHRTSRSASGDVLETLAREEAETPFEPILRGSLISIVAAYFCQH